jgi:hypothetical protein
MYRRGMRQTQPRKTRENLGKERAARTPLDTARRISLILAFKIWTPAGLFLFSWLLMEEEKKGLS